MIFCFSEIQGASHCQKEIFLLENYLANLDLKHKVKMQGLWWWCTLANNPSKSSGKHSVKSSVFLSVI